MRRLTRLAQHTVKKKAGIFVKIKAIKNKKEQIRYMLLIAY